MVPDWSSSKGGSNSRIFDPLLGLLGQGENSTDSPALNAPLLAHSTTMSTVICKNRYLYFLGRDKKQTLNSRPPTQLPNA